MKERLESFQGAEARNNIGKHPKENPNTFVPQYRENGEKKDLVC